MKISYFAETSGHQDLLISLRGVESAYFQEFWKQKDILPTGGIGLTVFQTGL